MLDRFYHLLLIPDRPLKVPDFLVVLSYAVSGKDKLTLMTQACCDEAVKMWKENRSAKIILSTGDNQLLGLSNARVMANYVREKGLPEEIIIEEGESMNTFENLLFSRKIIFKEWKGKRQPRIVLVAYDLHMRRVIATAKKVGYKNFGWVSARSGVTQAFGYKGWIQTRSRDTIFLYDIIATLVSRVRGWI